MRDLNNLNREHDESLKKKSCCQCPTDKEIIFCGCDCHKEQVNSFARAKCGEVYTEESGAYKGFTCESCKESLWDNNTIQFARLINELDLLGTFSDERLTELANATDLSQTEILDLVERAKNVYDETLEQL